MRQLLAHLPNRTRTLFRGDSGFFVGDLPDFLDERGHGYLIKVKLKGLVSLLETQKWQKVKGQPGWEGCEFSHQCETWSTSRKFMAVRREKEEELKGMATLFEMKEYDYFCYVLTDALTPWQAHKESCPHESGEWPEDGRLRKHWARRRQNL